MMLEFRDNSQTEMLGNRVGFLFFEKSYRLQQYKGNWCNGGTFEFGSKGGVSTTSFPTNHISNHLIFVHEEKYE